MSDDLVKRLREGNNWDWEMMNMGAEAADRIEALEGALREMIDQPRDVDQSYAELYIDLCIKARAALEGKDG
jgi:hypothetical protein